MTEGRERHPASADGKRADCRAEGSEGVLLSPVDLPAPVVGSVPRVLVGARGTDHQMPAETGMRGSRPDELAALRLVLAAIEDDRDEAEQIYLDAGPVPLILGLVAVAIGLGEHAHRSRAALRRTLLAATQAVEINSIPIE